MSAQPLRRGRQRGGLLIEALVAVIISAFALLGFTALQGRASGTAFEALQRSQALVLLDDMVARIDANRVDASRAQATEYVSANLLGSGTPEDCSATNGSARDLCEWGNLLRGSSETRGGAQVGSLLSARGCIQLAPGTTHRYIVAVAWQGVAATAGPASACGQGDALYPDESLRRAVTATVCVALLRDGATAPLTPRC